MLANAKKIRARNERRRAEQQANEESDDEEYRDADQNLDDLINDTDSEDDDDEPKQKKSKSKKFTDQLMETEDGEVVDLSAAHAAISSAHVRNKSKLTNVEVRLIFIQDSVKKNQMIAMMKSALLLTVELLYERRRIKRRILICSLPTMKKAFLRIFECPIKR